jgi:hypothetical protein
MDTWWLFYKILENSAVESGDQYLGKHGWEKEKHL